MSRILIIIPLAFSAVSVKRAVRTFLRATYQTRLNTNQACSRSVGSCLIWAFFTDCSICSKIFLASQTCTSYRAAVEAIWITVETRLDATRRVFESCTLSALCAYSVIYLKSGKASFTTTVRWVTSTTTADMTGDTAIRSTVRVSCSNAMTTTSISL